MIPGAERSGSGSNEVIQYFGPHSGGAGRRLGEGVGSGQWFGAEDGAVRRASAVRLDDGLTEHERVELG